MSGCTSNSGKCPSVTTATIVAKLASVAIVALAALAAISAIVAIAAIVAITAIVAIAAITAIAPVAAITAIVCRKHTTITEKETGLGIDNMITLNVTLISRRHSNPKVQFTASH